MSDKKKQLKKHKSIATGLFILMAIVCLIMVYFQKHNPQHWMGYVRAFSEAAMVGALADWFAVTALFKYPLGIKIPHTNLIENSKNAIGDNLGSFVTENFLTSENIRPYIEKIDLASFIASWLEHKKNQNITEIEIANLFRNIILNLDEKSVIQFLTNKANNEIQTIDIQSLVSKGLQYAIDQEEHNRLIDIIIPKAKEYVEIHREDIYNKVVEKNPILGLIGGKAVTNQLIGGIKTFLEDIADNPDHKIRKEITDKLKNLATKISTDPQWKIKFEAILQQFITPEKISEYATELWLSMKNTALEQLDNDQSIIRTYIKTNIQNFEKNLKEDEKLRNKINHWIRHSTYRLILKNIKEVGTLISNTVDNWESKELSEKLELEVGKDLQFIRINGTLVGGFVGLIIYIVTHFVF